MSRARGTRRGARSGFTLMEVLFALGVLAVALFVLMDAHYSTMRLVDVMGEELVTRQLLENLVAESELGVALGELSGEGDYGDVYPGFTWSYEATHAGSDDLVPLYSVDAQVIGPHDTRALRFYVFNPGLQPGEIRR